MALSEPHDEARRSAGRALSGRPRIGLVGMALAALLIVLAILSLTHGAASIAASRVFEILFRSGADGGAGDIGRDALVVLNIRLPRLLLGGMIGAALGGSGALMQGLFRNPLADPGLVGVSAGASLAAAATILFGERLPASLTGGASFSALTVAAFLGALASTASLYLIATRGGRTSIPTMLLAGVALAALAGSLTGLLAYISDDRQLRDLTFWSLGSLGGATWIKVEVLTPVCVLIVAATPFLSRGLNAMAFGEAEAFHLGIRVQRLKVAIIVLVAIAVGASVAAAGVIGFVGIVAPHMLRLAIGPDHRALLPLSALAGAALMIGADILARTLVAPAEMPIGILTAAVGAPFFLWLLLRGEGSLRF
jgi:iron complex transport system permease protein